MSLERKREVEKTMHPWRCRSRKMSLEMMMSLERKREVEKTMHPWRCRSRKHCWVLLKQHFLVGISL